MAVYRYYVDVIPVEPPLPTGERFRAQAHVMRVDASGRTEATTLLPAHYGVTHDEAEAQAEAEAREWVERRQSEK